MSQKTNKQLLKIWQVRLAYRERRLVKLKTVDKPKPLKIARAEYRVLVARRNVARYLRKADGSKLRVRFPDISVNRVAQGNSHGTIVPKLIVLHSTESHDRPGNQDIAGVLRFLEKTEDALGIHFVVDKEGLVGIGARINTLVYHARGVNSIAVGIEQIGFAHSTEWRRGDRLKQLERVAKILAYLSKELGIPLTHSTNHGVCRHLDLPKGGHTDPGSKKEYPFFYVLKLAKEYRACGW